MESWSAQLEEFRINFFLDTNILCYLIDNTYPTLTEFIKSLANMPVVSLFASEFVLAELIEMRKKEDYYQEVVKQSKEDGRYINISSFIKYNKRYDIPHYSYEGKLVEPVVTKVGKDIEKIVKDFNIAFDSQFNNQLFAPMKDICLNTKISKEDSLMLVSSLFRSIKRIPPYKVVLLTNDLDFETWSNSSKGDIEKILKEQDLTMPYIEHIKSLGKMFGNNSKLWNLSVDINGKEIAKAYVSNCILKFFKKNYIGKIILSGENVTKAPKHTLFVKVKASSMKNNFYIMILNKDFSFLYCPQNKADFYHKNKSIKDSFIPKSGEDQVGFVCELRENEDEELFNQLNKEGNMVFIHPDSNYK